MLDFTALATILLTRTATCCLVLQAQPHSPVQRQRQTAPALATKSPRQTEAVIVSALLGSKRTPRPGRARCASCKSTSLHRTRRAAPHVLMEPTAQAEWRCPLTVHMVPSAPFVELPSGHFVQLPRPANGWKWSDSHGRHAVKPFEGVLKVPFGHAGGTSTLLVQLVPSGHVKQLSLSDEG